MTRLHRFRRAQVWPALALALLGPVLGVSACRAARAENRELALVALRDDVRERAFALEVQIGRVGEAVASVAALFEASVGVSPQEFSTFTAPILARHPGLLALEWVPRVPRAERERHEGEARVAGFRGYQILERGPSGEMVPAGDRAELYPVSLVEPLEPNLATLGFDLASEPTSDSPLLKAAQTGNLTLTDPIDLVQRQGDSRGLLLFFPAYAVPAGAGGEGAGTLKGLAVGVLLVDRMVAGSLPPGWQDDSGHAIRLELVDDDARGRSVRLFPGAGADAPHGPWSWREPLMVAGQRWSLIGYPSETLLAPQHRSQPVVLGMVTFLGFELLLGVGLMAEARRREEERSRDADLLSSVLHSVVEGVLVADTDGRILLANRAAQRMLGSSAGVPPARWPERFGLYTPGTTTHFPAQELPLARTLRGEEVREVEVFVRNPLVPSGAWASVSGAPLKDGEGHAVGGVVVFRDVTAAKRAAELSRRLSSAVEQAADAVFITSRKGVIEYVNPAFERVTGYSLDEVIGHNPRVLKSGLQEPQYYDELWSTILAGKPFAATVVNRRKNGELFYAEQTITPMKDGSTGQISHFVSVMRDITERLRVRERRVEMEVAAKVQRRLFPQAAPRLDGYDIAGAVTPALDAGGDYFDFIPLPDGRLAIVVADACGHGVGPALIMAQTRAHLRSLARARRSLPSIVEELNSALLADLADEHFVTMLLASLNPRTGAVQWANAGHPSGFVLDASGTVKRVLNSTGLPLGLFQGPVGVAGPHVVLEPGDLLVVPTDGFGETTSPDGQELGFEAVLDVVRRYRERPAAEIVERVLDAVRAFRRGLHQEDDLTLVVCKREPAA